MVKRPSQPNITYLRQSHRLHIDEAISTSPAKLDEVIDALRADLGEVIDALRAGTEVVDQSGSAKG